MTWWIMNIYYTGCSLKIVCFFQFTACRRATHLIWDLSVQKLLSGHFLSKQKQPSADKGEVAVWKFLEKNTIFNEHPLHNTIHYCCEKLILLFWPYLSLFHYLSLSIYLSYYLSFTLQFSFSCTCTLSQCKNMSLKNAWKWNIWQSAINN